MKAIQLAGGFVILRDGEFECFAGPQSKLSTVSAWAALSWNMNLVISEWIIHCICLSLGSRGQNQTMKKKSPIYT